MERKNKEHLKNYRKKYHEEHPEKAKAAQERYWAKKAAEAEGAHE
ncbi:hypothetical protein [Bacillus sp. FJAT-52991]|uniref:Uncharacterized protein n=1 Tax=Bacillus kandeliae TaxID=3129297 RepID=A0ABZ2NCJ6_9BACI